MMTRRRRGHARRSATVAIRTSRHVTALGRPHRGRAGHKQLTLFACHYVRDYLKPIYTCAASCPRTKYAMAMEPAWRASAFAILCGQVYVHRQQVMNVLDTAV